MFAKGSRNPSGFTCTDTVAGFAVELGATFPAARTRFGGVRFLVSMEPFCIRPTYALRLRTLNAIPSAARHSAIALRLWPLSRAALISGHRLRIWAAFVGG